ncbi:MAG: transglutaminase-like cysteine peptidase [Verrucomicrobiota bacterium]
MKKTATLVSGYLAFCVTSDAALVSLQRTPYDRQLERVQHVLDRDACENNGNPGDLETINQAMREAYNLPYSSYQEWQSPEETLQNKRADCKARAVLLHHKLNQAGVGSHRLVIGRLKGGNSQSHTWLVWKTAEGEYLLDPTYYRKAVAIEKISAGKYIPEFIYCGGGKYGYIPNSVVLDGLDEIPPHIQQRRNKTRVFLAEEERVQEPVQANKETLSAPDLTQKPDKSADGDQAETIQEARTRKSDHDDLKQQVKVEDLSITALH